MRGRMGIVAAVLALASLCGCGDDKPKDAPGAPGKPGATAQSRGKIGLSVLTLANPFFTDIADAMRDEAKKNGYELVVVSGEFDVATQQNQVKDFIVQKGGIVLTPCNSTAIGRHRGPTRRDPVFTADIACIDPGAKWSATSHRNQEAAGRRPSPSSRGGGKGKVAILTTRKSSR